MTGVSGDARRLRSVFVTMRWALARMVAENALSAFSGSSRLMKPVKSLEM